MNLFSWLLSLFTPKSNEPSGWDFPAPVDSPDSPLPELPAHIPDKETEPVRGLETEIAMRNLIITADYVFVQDTRLIRNDAAAMKIWESRWPDFMPWELDTRDFSVRMSTKSLDAAQAVRTEFGQGMYVTNACRNWPHNVSVGGKENSDHLTEDKRGNPLNATAFDIAIASPAFGRKLEAIAIKHGFNAIGRYPVSSFIHISMRKPKPNGKIYQWGRWP